jgi:hypothetical protein
MGVDDLIAESAGGEVRSLGKEHDAIYADAARTANESTICWPETGDDARDGAFATAIGASDEKMFAGMNDKR